ncbi:MAG: FkbM family methyltransferase [Acidobacteriota bacterium]|jgi:FkbM family methyltransferase
MGRTGDLRFRAEAALRRLTGSTSVPVAGCRWSAHTANALKTVRGMRRANPIMERLLREISADDVFLDVGAANGAYAIQAACASPAPRRVYAIEPSAAPYLALLENIELNHCGDRCVPMPIAAGAEEGFVEFKIDSLDHSTETSHVLSDNEAAHRPTGALWQPCSITTRVPCFSIDHLVDSEMIERPTMVKIDTEGYEGLVLQGMRRSARGVRWLAVEVHPDRLVGASSADALVERIAGLGFETVAADGRGRQQHLLFHAAAAP